MSGREVSHRVEVKIPPVVITEGGGGSSIAFLPGCLFKFCSSSQPRLKSVHWKKDHVGMMSFKLVLSSTPDSLGNSLVKRWSSLL